MITVVTLIVCVIKIWGEFTCHGMWFGCSKCIFGSNHHTGFSAIRQLGSHLLTQLDSSNFTPRSKTPEHLGFLPKKCSNQPCMFSVKFHNHKPIIDSSCCITITQQLVPKLHRHIGVVHHCPYSIHQGKYANFC